jgi:hypothetical protein
MLVKPFQQVDFPVSAKNANSDNEPSELSRVGSAKNKRAGKVKTVETALFLDKVNSNKMN